ncbi:MAG TPA: 50S ribosomal protein L14 [bacterium]|nr:50S ribosomal protein L14 [bacterium]
MIQTESVVVVADNTGARSVLCIKVLGGSKKRYARVGEVFIAAVQEALPHGNIAKKKIVRCVLVRSSKEVRRADGTYVRSDDNACVIIDNDGNPRGTRVFGPVFREVRACGYQKIASLAPELI